VLSSIVGRSVLDVETQRFSANLSATKSTVGLMVTHTTIENILVGSPAYLSARFKKGDKILEIDGTKATTNNLIELLVGTDLPGSTVTLKCSRDSGVFQNTFDVTLMRMSTAKLVDHRRMFELFTKIKDIAQIEVSARVTLPTGPSTVQVVDLLPFLACPFHRTTRPSVKFWMPLSIFGPK